MHSAAVSSSLPSCICLCYDSVCTIVVYCTDGGCYFCISVYRLWVRDTLALQNWRLCYLPILDCHCSNVYVCLSVCFNLDLHVAHYKSVQVILQHLNEVLSKHLMPVLTNDNEGVFDYCF